MANQVENGKAFEYAIAKVYYDAIKEKTNTQFDVVIKEDEAYNNVKNCFDGFDEERQNKFLSSARATVNTLFKIEPGLTSFSNNKKQQLSIRIAKDGEGQSGDVRDVIFSRDSPAWEIGFSAKNNNDAVKHSRLSKVLDFGKEWVGVNVSNQYWNDIKPIFDLIDNKLKSNPKTTWDDLGDVKEREIYIPSLVSLNIC